MKKSNYKELEYMVKPRVRNHFKSISKYKILVVVVYTHITKEKKNLEIVSNDNILFTI